VISSKIWASQALKKIAKPSHQWEVVRHYVSLGEWEDSVCFERGARMDSFAAVLTTFGCSSMYEVICVKKQTFWLMGNNNNNCEYMCVLPNFFPRRLKINR
jgi:hypothetical protein